MRSFLAATSTLVVAALTLAWWLRDRPASVEAVAPRVVAPASAPASADAETPLPDVERIDSERNALEVSEAVATDERDDSAAPRAESSERATLDGLGCVGDGAHADHEHIVIDPSLERCALLARLMLSPPAEPE